MTPPRSVLLTWRALEAADRMRAEFDRYIADLEALSRAVRAESHRLDGDGWRGAAFDAVLAQVEAAHHHNRTLCEQARGLRDTGVQALSDLHYTALALLDYVADAEAAGCPVADNWTVTADSSADAEWAEVIAEAVAAVDRAEQRGRQAISAVGHEMRHLAAAFGAATLDEPPPATRGPARSGPGGEIPAAAATSPAHSGQMVPAAAAQEVSEQPASGLTADQLADREAYYQRALGGLR